MIKSRFQYLCLVLLFGISIISCSGQDNVYSYKDYKRYSKYSFLDIDKSLVYSELEDFLPFGYVKDGTIDYTVLIQKVLDEHRNVIFPDFPLLVNDTGLLLKSNSNLFFRKNSRLIMQESFKNKYSIFILKRVDNVQILNPTLVGDRENHLGSKGEWGMGISIYGSSNVKIVNASIEKMWGDGIYIADFDNEVSRDVLVSGGNIDNSRRNGLSIISGKNITIKNLLVANTNGVKPGAGIDIEPNTRLNILENIVLNDVTTFNNENEGILIVLTRIGSDSFSKNVDIKIDKHIDIESNYAMRFGSGFRPNDKELNGNIYISNSKWIGVKQKDLIKISGNLNKLPNVIFQNIETEEKRFEPHLNKIMKNNYKFKILN